MHHCLCASVLIRILLTVSNTRHNPKSSTIKPLIIPPIRKRRGPRVNSVAQWWHPGPHFCSQLFLCHGLTIPLTVSHGNTIHHKKRDFSCPIVTVQSAPLHDDFPSYFIGQKLVKRPLQLGKKKKIFFFKRELPGLDPLQEMKKVSPCLEHSSMEKGRSELLGTLPARKGGSRWGTDMGHGLLQWSCPWHTPRAP